MRLFRRASREEQASEDAPDRPGPATAAPAAAADDGVARQEPQPTGDWMTRPPLAPSFNAMPTTFRVQTLPEILTSHQDTRLSTGALGHAVVAAGPSGSVGGLAVHSGDISAARGPGELPLREPHLAPAPLEPALEVRRLADPAARTTPTAGPLSTTTAAPTPTLPEPTVSRSLLRTAPLVAPAAAERPLPVARVVDAPSAAAPSPTTPVVAMPSLESDDGPAPLVGDTRVGGFGVPLDGGDPIVPEEPDADVPRMTAPAELAPPIQPRRLQRRVDAAAPTPPRPTPARDDAPLVGHDRATTSPDPATREPTPTAAAAGPPLPLVAPATASPLAPTASVSRLADAPTATKSSPRDSSSADAPTASSPGSRSSSPPDADEGSPATRPLVGDTPAISATETLGAAVDDTVEPDESERGDLSLHAALAAPPSPSEPVLEAPIQRLAVASLVGESPLLDAPASTDGAPATADDAPSESTSIDLTLAPRAAPTVGSAKPMVNVQPMSEGVGATSSADTPGTAGLPLAPNDLGSGTLTPPTASSTAPADVQRSEAGTAGTGIATRSLAAPAPVVARRTPATLPLVRPVGAGRSIGEQATSPMTTLSAPAVNGSSESTPVPLRRVSSSVDLASVGAGTVDGTGTSRGAESLPLAPVQRLDASTSAGPSPSGGQVADRRGPATSDLPLHTPAASIPTAADVAVRAGLAERGPDGSLFSTAPTATTSFVVQRQASDDLAVQTLPSIAGRPAPASAGAARGGPSAGASAAAGAANAPGGDGGGGEADGNDAAADAKNLAAEAKKLYPFIRSALEADIRRQIEGKSRASRFRP